MDQLHELGFAVTVWVMPFLQEGSAACREARALGRALHSSPQPEPFFYPKP